MSTETTRPASQRAFYRLSGGGNDFLALVEPMELPEPGEIRALCRRGLSLGADGLFTLRRTATGAQMDYFNADGEGAALCLNGTRCAAALAFELGWSDGEGEILTGAGAVGARRTASGAIEVEVDPPGGAPRALDVEIDCQVYSGWKVLIGVPHFVLPWPQTLARAPVAELGPPLRGAPAMGPEGANVDFVRFVEPGLIELRTYERGVEAETLACGTGALAAAAVGLATARSKLPLEVLTLGGYRLRVAGEAKEDRPTRWTLAGDARLVATGEISAGALEIPLAPDWSA